MASYSGRIQGVAFSPDGRYLAYWTDNAYLHLLDLEADTSTQLNPDNRTTPIGRGIAFNADSSILITGGYGLGYDGGMLVWDTERKSLVTQFAQDKFILIVDISPDGRLLISGDVDGNITLWGVPEDDR